jgi:hypothetical protein
MRNDFALALLSYSAERDECIGRPERWASPPELVVSSQLHTEMEQFADEIWQKQERAIWTILIGGPGNGKSEAVGSFVRKLAERAKSDGAKVPIEAKSGKGGGAINYWFGGDLPHGSIVVLQDASVPRCSGSNPAQDLLESFDLCAKDGIHLLACANRGMILRAAREARVHKHAEWLVKLLDQIDAASAEEATADNARFTLNVLGKNIEVRVWPLDHESCLFGAGSANPWAQTENSLLDQIIKRAVRQSNWEDLACSECPARDACPFLADAKWLRDDSARGALLQILRNAEVWSDQRLVLREALGLISMILVGCPPDFVDAGVSVHPCDWVLNRVQGVPARPVSVKALLELASHRIYNDLFCRQSPAGLALGESEQRRDSWVTKRLAALDPIGAGISKAIKEVDREFAKQAGPLRLVGPDGMLKVFDPAKDCGWCAKVGISCDGDIFELSQMSMSFKCGIEASLDSLFLFLENAAKNLRAHEDTPKIVAALYRWAGAHYLRYLGTLHGVTHYAEGIAAFLHLFKNPNDPIQYAGQTLLLKELLRDITQSPHGDSVELAPSFVAQIDPLKPKPLGARDRAIGGKCWPANDRLNVSITQSSSAPINVILTAKVFAEACRLHFLHLAPWSTAPNIESVVRTWSDDYLVSQGQFKARDAIEHRGSPPIVFESVGSGEIRVRAQQVSS